MLILIEKDPSTRIPKEVTFEQAQTFAVDFPVFVVDDEGAAIGFDDWKAAQPPDDPIPETTPQPDTPAPIPGDATYAPLADPVAESSVVEGTQEESPTDS